MVGSVLSPMIIDSAAHWLLRCILLSVPLGLFKLYMLHATKVILKPVDQLDVINWNFSAYRNNQRTEKALVGFLRNASLILLSASGSQRPQCFQGCSDIAGQSIEKVGNSLPSKW